jgi:hypothetical protein
MGVIVDKNIPQGRKKGAKKAQKMLTRLSSAKTHVCNLSTPVSNSVDKLYVRQIGSVRVQGCARYVFSTH